MPMQKLAATPNCSSRIKTDRSSITSALLAAFAPTESADEMNIDQGAAIVAIDGETPPISWRVCDTDFDCTSDAANEVALVE